MIKQTAGLFLPVILFLELARGKKRLLVSTGIMTAVFLLLSMPYLFLYPDTYLYSITRGMGSYWYYEELPANNYPIPLSILAFYWPEPFKYIAITVIYYGIPFGGFLAAFWASAWVINQKDTHVYQKQLVTIALLLSLAMHTFWARGIYKYYLVALLPFLILYGAVLHGPLVPLLASKFDQASCPFVNQLGFHCIPNWVKSALPRLRKYIFAIVNRTATWWFILIFVVSIAIYVVHRFVTPAILLALFFSLLVYAWYDYAYKGSKKKNQKLN